MFSIAVIYKSGRDFEFLYLRRNLSLDMAEQLMCEAVEAVNPIGTFTFGHDDNNDTFIIRKARSANLSNRDFEKMRKLVLKTF